MGSLTINYGVINSVLGAAAKKSGVAEERALAIANTAGQTLAQCINSAMGALNGGQLAAVGEATASGATKVGEDTYSIGIDISQQFRPSLVPQKYGGVDDMAALFNNGWSASNEVIGFWHGRLTRSRTSFPGVHFVQNGIAAFMGSGGGDYTIVSCTPSGRFT